MREGKQIEGLDELTTTIYEAAHKTSVLNYRWIAEALYNAGYHKQAEGAWIEEHGKTYIPAEYDEDGYLILHDYTINVCSICGRREPKKEPYCNCGAKMKGV